MKKVYFDNAATTPLRDEVVEVMARVLKDNFGNPSSTHGFGRASKVLLEQSRKDIAKALNVSASEIIFTSGGTESNNFILKNAVQNLGVTRIITSKIEHHAVLHTIENLQQCYNITIDFVDLKPNGDIDYSSLEHLLKSSSKTLVSLMHVNNEIGNILDVKRVAELCATYDALFHSDTVQSVGHYDLDFKALNIDFAVASAHKFNGPKGVGFAYIKRGIPMKPQIFGGEQERGLRAGTEAIHNIVGMAKALQLALTHLQNDVSRLLELKTYCIKQLKNHIPEIEFNGGSANIETSAFTILNIRLPKIKDKSSMLQFQLDLKGIACSRGSACQSGSYQNSHVLKEILSEEALNQPSLRLSFGIFNSTEDVDYFIDVLKSISLKSC